MMKRLVITLVLLLTGMGLGIPASAQGSIPLPGRAMIKLLPDPNYPYVYGLNQGGGNSPGTLLRLSAVDGAILNELPINFQPADMAITPEGSAIYIISSDVAADGSTAAIKVDLDTFSIVFSRVIVLEPRNSDGGAIPIIHLAAALGGRVFVADARCTTYPEEFDNFFGLSRIVEGSEDAVYGIASVRNGNTLYGYSESPCGGRPARITRFERETNGIIGSKESFVLSTPHGRPLPVMLDTAEKWVFCGKVMVGARDVSVLTNQFSEDIYSISPDGAIAFGETKVFSSASGLVIAQLPGSSTVQCVFGNRGKLFRYDGSDQAIHLYSLDDFAAVSTVEAAVKPSDGSVVSPPVARLAWTPAPLALHYEVYFGTDRNAVAAATPDSAEHLGEVADTQIPLALPPVGNSTYYWRVDAADTERTNVGSIWSFTVTPLMVSPTEIHISVTNGFNPPDLTLALGAAGSLSWYASITGRHWLTLDKASGTGPSTLSARFVTSSFEAGRYSNQIELVVGGLALEIPVIVDVAPLKGIRAKMVADPKRHTIYTLQAPDSPGTQGRLLFINTDTGAVDTTLPVGTNSTDFTIHYAEDRIYAASGGEPRTYVIDLETRTSLPWLSFGSNVYKIDACRAGRVITQGLATPQKFPVNLVNAANGSILSSFQNTSIGSGLSDSAGGFYYHVNSNSTQNVHLHKFDIRGDSATEVAQSGEEPFGSGNLVMSPDGQHLFWGGFAFDTNLNFLGSFLDHSGQFREEIVSVSTDGRIAFSKNSAFEALTFQNLNTLPLVADFSAVDGQNQRLWYYNAASGALGSVDIQSFWLPSFSDYISPYTSIHMGDSVKLGATPHGLSPLVLQWRHEGTNLPFATNSILSLTNFQAAQQGRYELVVSNQFGVRVEGFQLTMFSAPVIVVQPQNTTVVAGRTLNLTVGISGTPPFSYSWYFENELIPGTTGTNLSISNVQFSNGGFYRVIVSNESGSVYSDRALVRVASLPPSIIEEPVSQSTHASFPITFSVSAEGSLPIIYRWFRNGVPLIGATEPQIYLADPQAGDLGGYYVVVSNLQGSVTSAVAQLDITPQAPLFSTQPHGAPVRLGGNIALTATLAGTEPISFRWLHNGTNLPGANRATLNIANASLADEGLYTLMASNTAGSTASLPAVVDVYLNPMLTTKPITSVFDAGDTATLVAAASGVPQPTYAWYRSGVDGVLGTNSTLTLTNIQASQTDYYTVHASNAYGIDSSTVRLSVFGPPSHVLSWGDDSSGQTTIPTDLTAAVAVAGGDSHSLALHHDGTISAWGGNGYGQRIVPPHSSRYVSIAAGAVHSLAIDEGGDLFAWGANESHQSTVPFEASKNVLSMAAGDSHSLALLADGTVVAWGDNTYGQTNSPPGVHQPGIRVRAIASGKRHCLALFASGMVTGWGYNASGQALPPRGLSNVVSIAAGHSHSVALLADGTISAWGDNNFGQTTIPEGLSNVVAIAAGDFHTLALRSDGSVVAWGNDSYGQLDIPADLGFVSSIASGTYHGLALVPEVTIQARMTPSGLVLEWPGVGVLQSAPSLYGPWNPVGAVGNSFTNQDTVAPMRYFRLTQ